MTSNRTNATWNLAAPPGFQGLRDDLSLMVYEKHLPHWRQKGATYFVTFRLADSLPQAKLQELEALKADWARRHRSFPIEDDREGLAREVMRRIEAWLDQGLGDCVLRTPGVSEILADVMLQDDGQLQELGCYVLMPNHIHAVVRPMAPANSSLEDILQRWKGRSSFRINRHLKRNGTLWQRESYDRIIRDEEHLYRTIQYIGRNPRLAGLPLADYRLWIRPTWSNSGWTFES